MEPLFQEEVEPEDQFAMELERDRLLTEILEVINDLTTILEVINDLAAVTEKSDVSFVVRPKKKKILDAVKTLDWQVCFLKQMMNCFQKTYELDFEMSDLWGKGPNPYATPHNK
ncbi:hypothetical protein Pyn_25221 [Prunus yedoensis var. nudiflora]|uniref:Uncharacterized protein n=1 Tax=Prunus yedoensis var. nudiflora TaxID=2094558 RepID=A0A314UW00_PRUYE|nr:hypothetical protein Pyn_25221 [Prunus yedoensis var. nudiflora]